MSSILSKLINLAGNIVGTLTVPNGGTGDATLASNGVLYGNGTGAINALAVNATATNKFLTQVSSGAPAWNTIVAGDLPTATSTAFGAVKTFVPSQVGGVTTVTNADATLTAADGFEIILMSTGTTTRIVNLPTAATSTGRRIKIIKTDNADITHGVTVTPNGSEKINGAATQTTFGQYSFQHIICDGSNWFNIEEPVSFGSISTSFLMNSSSNAATGNPKTFTFKKEGRIVTLWSLTTILATSNGSDIALQNNASTLLPSWAFPDATGGTSTAQQVEENGGQLAAFGLLAVTTSGQIQIYKTNSLAAFASGTGGATTPPFTVYSAAAP